MLRPQLRRPRWLSWLLGEDVGQVVTEALEARAPVGDSERLQEPARR
jgi:hypothetical protein